MQMYKNEMSFVMAPESVTDFVKQYLFSANTYA